MSIKIKRVYEVPRDEDGIRILVDRLWPRGLTKEKAHVDLWLKDISPSTQLRQWFARDASQWQEFKKRYLNELQERSEAIQTLKSELAKGPVTLVYSAKDEKHNGAVFIKNNIALLSELSGERDPHTETGG
ncbi:MAG: DUF488 family protein [Pseudomonas sp.]|nr:DUF488 family protein [Pseudomonas sp.]